MELIINDQARRIIAALEDVMERQNMSQSQIERECGLGSIFSNLKRNGLSPSVNTVYAFVTRFPHYSAEWIITGRGSMHYRQQTQDNDDLLKAYDALAAENFKLKQNNEALTRLNQKLQEKFL